MSGRDAAVVLFDGDCALCNGSVRWILRWEKTPRYAFAALQSTAANRLLQGFAVDADDLSSVLVLDGGKLYARSDAVLHVLQDMRGLWQALRIFRVIPRVLRDGVYDFIGQRRYRWFGRADRCVLANPALLSRVRVD